MASGTLLLLNPASMPPAWLLDAVATVALAAAGGRARVIVYFFPAVFFYFLPFFWAVTGLWAVVPGDFAPERAVLLPPPP